MSTLRDALQGLRIALDNDQPVELTDAELFDLAECAADELVRRMPRYALEQGDLDAGDEPRVDAREDLLLAVRDTKEREEVSAETV